MSKVLPFIIALFLAGCFLESLENELESFDDINDADVMLLVIDKTEIKAYGADITTVTARIPEEASSIDITFSTTAGIFPVSATKTIMVRADSVSGGFRFATTTLISDTTLGVVYVTSSINDIRRTQSLVFKDSTSSQ